MAAAAAHDIGEVAHGVEAIGGKEGFVGAARGRAVGHLDAQLLLEGIGNDGTPHTDGLSGGAQPLCFGRKSRQVFDELVVRRT